MNTISIKGKFEVILGEKDVLEKKETLFSKIKEVAGVTELSDGMKSFFNSQIIKKSFEAMDDYKKSISERVKGNVVATFADKVYETIDLKTDYLGEVLQNGLKGHSFSLLGKQSLFSFQVENIPTQTGPVTSQKMFVELDGNQCSLGILAYRDSVNNYKDYDKLTQNLKEMLEKKFSGKELSNAMDTVFPYVQTPESTSVMINTRNKSYTENIEPLLDESVQLISKKVINMFDLNERNLLEKMYDIKSELNESDVESLNSTAKLITTRVNKAKDGLDKDVFDMVIKACEVYKIDIPFKEKDPTKVNEKIAVLSLLNSFKVSSLNDVVAEVNSIIKNSSGQTRSYLDVALEEDKIKKFLAGEKIKGKNLNDTIKDLKKDLNNPAIDEDNKKKNQKEFDLLIQVRKLKEIFDTCVEKTPSKRKGNVGD